MNTAARPACIWTKYIDDPASALSIIQLECSQMTHVSSWHPPCCPMCHCPLSNFGLPLIWQGRRWFVCRAVHRALKKCVTCTMEPGFQLVNLPHMERATSFFGPIGTSIGFQLRLLLPSDLADLPMAFAAKSFHDICNQQSNLVAKRFHCFKDSAPFWKREFSAEDLVNNWLTVDRLT